MSRSDEHATLVQALARWQAGSGASELHGSLSGYLCAGGHAGAADWLDKLEVTPGVEGATRDPLLRDLFERARAQFATDPAQDRVTIRLRDPSQTNDALAALRALTSGSESSDFAVAQEPGGITLTLSQAALRDRATAAVQQSIEIVRRRIDETGVLDPAIAREGASRIVVPPRSVT